MLPAKDWLEAAKALPEGGRSRINHTCGGGRTLLITNQRDEWTAYCFRCDEPGVERKPTESWRDRLVRLTHEREVDALIERAVDPPGPPNFDVNTWPEPARVWLYKAGLGLPEIAEIGAYYHGASGRVILPVFDGPRIIYWQARDVSWTRKSHRPKYINPKVDKRYLVARFGRGDPLVLTEDVLSAYRVGQVTEAWSLMGTSMTDHIAANVPSGRYVVVWLDPDRAGIKAARAIVNQLTSLGIRTCTIKARADPKCLSSKEIRCLLNSACLSVAL